MNKIPTYILALNKRLYQLLKRIPKKDRSADLERILETEDPSSPPDGGREILESYLRKKSGYARAKSGKKGPTQADLNRLSEYRKILSFVEDHQRDPGRYH